MTFVDYDEESITEVTQTGTVVSKYNTKTDRNSCLYLTIILYFGKETVKYNKINHLPLKSDLQMYKPYFNYSHKY